MFDRFTDRARKVFSFARQEAERFNHDYIGTEHILLGLVKEGSGVAANVLENLDVDLEKVRLEVEKLVKSAPDMPTMGQLPFTPHAKKVIEFAITEARALNHNYIGTEHLLLGLLRVQEGPAAQVMLNLCLNMEDVRNEVMEYLGTDADEMRLQPRQPILDRYCAYVDEDTPFRRLCRLKQSQYREARGWACGEGGQEEHKRKLGNYLTEADAENGRNFLSSAIFELAKQRMEQSTEGIDRHRLLYNMLTSQTLCFNLFLPQQADLDLATAIWSAIMPGIVKSVEAVLVEHSPRRMDPRYTGDKSAFDACVKYVHGDSTRGLLGIEVKYTEPFSSPAGNPTPRLLELAESSQLYANDDWQRMTTQQLWRTHLLAESMRQDGYEHATYLVLHAARDEECVHAVKLYADCLSAKARQLDCFDCITLEELYLKAVPVVPAHHLSWLSAFKERYLFD
jgi:hypothetical protein